MATITIRQLDDNTKARLRVRAAHHGRSMEEEAREILRTALVTSPTERSDLSEKIRKRFAAFGGVKLQIAKRGAMRGAPDFSK